MKDIYNDYSLFYQPIESKLYSIFVISYFILEKNEEGVMIAKEIVRLHLKLRKAEYIAECIKSGEIKDTEENKKCFDNITHYKELLQQLEQQSELPTIRQSIQKVMRKSLICYNWEQVHSTYVFLLYNYTM